MRKVEELCEDKLSEWIKLETGVRQGCVLSPLLYALFINGLVKKLRDSKLGVPMLKNTLETLLYAAENKTNLQKMLDIVAEYAKKWRFEINPKKSGVVVFGNGTHLGL